MKICSIQEEQRKNDLENHQKLNLELEERENLLKKLSNAIWIHIVQ